MNSPALVKQGSAIWQGVMKAWGTIQSGLEQQDPSNWLEIIRQPLFGNRFLTNDLGVQWGTDPKTNIRTWAEKGFKSLKDIATEDCYGWKSYPELLRFRNSTRVPQLFTQLVANIPWAPTPQPATIAGQWLASKEEDGQIQYVYHVTNPAERRAKLYRKDNTGQLQLIGEAQQYPKAAQEVRIV